MNISTYESRIHQLQEGGPGYDLVIKVNSTNSLDNLNSAEIVGGSFDSAYSKALRGVPINVKIFGYADLGEDGAFYREFLPDTVYADRGYNDCIMINLIGVTGSAYNSNTLQKYAANSSGGAVNQKVYVSNKSKMLVITESGITIRTNP